MTSSPEVRSYPATPMQVGMIFRMLAEPDSGENVVQIRVCLDDALDIERFQAAWHAVVGRHAALRTTFRWEGLDAPVQVVSPEFRPSIVELDWSALDDEERLAEQEAYLARDRRAGFDLQSAPPIRLTLARCRAGHWFCWSIHHALMDGRSFFIVFKDVFDHYAGVAATTPVERRPFWDFATHLATLDHGAAREYWTERLADVETDTFMPASARSGTDEPRYTDRHAAVETTVSAALSERLRALGKANRVGMVTVVQGAWALLLHHHAQRDRILFGTTRSLRQTFEGGPDIVGLLINTVPVAVDFADAPDVGSLLSAIRAGQKATRKFENCPMSVVQDCSAIGSKTVFDSLVVYDEGSFEKRWHGVPSARPPANELTQENQTNYPLTLVAFGEDEIMLRLEYDVSLHGRARCERLLEQMIRLFEGFVAAPDSVAAALPWLGDDELGRLASWNDTARDHDLEHTLQSLFEAQVARTPQAVALRFDGATIDYAELAARSNRLARHLRRSGVGPGQVVGVCSERSIEMMVAIYAILAAGGAYLPLDPEFPADRLAYVIEDSGVSLILERPAAGVALPARADVTAISLFDEHLWSDQSGAPLEPESGPDDLAYLLYTSGSTGRPKGTMIEHRSIVNRLLWMQDAFALEPGEAVLQKTPYTFDVSVWELFWPLQVGAQLVIALPGGHRDTDYLARTIVEHDITTLHFVPSMLQLFVEESRAADCACLRRVICSGEALPRDLQDRLFAVLDVELHNLYGPTEAAVDVTWWRCEPDSPLPFVPIGKPIDNVRMHIVDRHLNPLPAGVPGELCIAGVQVGRGYLGRAELTAERFVENPFGEGRLYRTGDLARYLDDGNIEYLGRLDFQVKIRGQRIELGEVEQVLSAHAGVKQVVATVFDAPAGDVRIAAYVVADSLSTEDLQRHARAFLPEVMIPDAWIRLEHMPLNPSGKADRAALPPPTLESTATRAPTAEPATEAERRVLSIWHEILGNGGAGTDDAFFDAGGNSLLLLRLSNRLGEEFGVKIPVQDLLRETTVARQAAHLARTAPAGDAALESAADRARERMAARTRRRRPVARKS